MKPGCAEQHRHPRGDVTVLSHFPLGDICMDCRMELKLITCDHCGYNTLRVARLPVESDPSTGR